MSNRLARPFLYLFFVALLATPLAIKHLSASGHVAESGVSTGELLERYGFYVREVAQTSGIDFVHTAPRLDPKLDHIMPQIASMGASVSVVDFDRDGWQDLYVTNSGEGSMNALYRNEGDGTFRDVAAELGIADVNRPETGVSMGAVWGDYNNDRFEDLFLYKWGRPELFRNDAGKGFTRVTEQAGLPDWTNANTAVWFDYNRDGHLDLFLGGYFPEHLNLWKLETTRIMPESFEYARNGGRNYLFRNNGDGSFDEVGEELGVSSRRWALSAAAADLRGTGYPDLYVANDYGVDELYLNEEGQRFREAGEQVEIGFVPKSGMNVSFGDVLNRGEFAIYVTNISEEGILLQGNNLWVPTRWTEDGIPKFQNLAGAMGVELGGWSYGAQFGDLNNDGWLDLYLTNGFVSGEPGTSYWYDYSKVTGGNREIISDARNWPAMDGRSLAGYQKKRLWINDGAGRFQEIAQVVGASDMHDGRAVALVDLWNRGVLDVVVANQRGPLLVYKNTVAPERTWVAFELEGSVSNRSAIGAQVRLFWNGREQLQEVSGGSGFGAQNQRRLHFGLGESTVRIEKAVIRWPSGRVQTLTDLEPGVVHKVKEPR